MEEKIWTIIFILSGLVMLGVLGVSVITLFIFIYNFLTGLVV